MPSGGDLVPASKVPDVRAVAQHGDAIAQPEHFRQPVRHVEQRRAAALEPLEDGEQ